MEELILEIRRTLIYMLAWSLLLTAGAAWRGDMAAVYGLVFGSLGSMLYLLLMGYRIKRSSALPPQEAVSYMRAGWLIRLSLIVFFLMIAVKLPFLNFWFVVVGLFSHHFVTVFSALIFIVKTFLYKKRN